MNGGDVDRGAGGFARVLGGPGREKEQAREEEGRCEFASRAGRGESEFHLVLEPPCDRSAELKRLIKRNRHHLNTSDALA